MASGGPHPVQAVAVAMPPGKKQAAWGGGEGGTSYVGSSAAVGFSDDTIRRGFLRKVFGILGTQLMVTALAVLAFSFVDSLGQWVRDNPGAYTLAWVLGLATLIALYCCESVRRSYPTNLIVLCVFTLVESYMLGALASRFETQSVLVAMVSCAAITMALGVYAFQTKTDWTTRGGYLLTGMMCVLLMLVFFFIFPTALGAVVLGVAVSALFCCFIIYDLQLIMVGKHKYTLGPDESIVAALNVYIDVVQLFMLILYCTGSRREE